MDAALPHAAPACRVGAAGSRDRGKLRGATGKDGHTGHGPNLRLVHRILRRPQRGTPCGGKCGSPRRSAGLGAFAGIRRGRRQRPQPAPARHRRRTQHHPRVQQLPAARHPLPTDGIGRNAIA